MKEEGTRKQETEVKEIKKFLDTLKIPEKLITKTKQQFLRHASKFFVQGDKLWR